MLETPFLGIVKFFACTDKDGSINLFLKVFFEYVFDIIIYVAVFT